MATLTCGVCGEPVDGSLLLCSCGASTAHARPPRTQRFEHVGTGRDDPADASDDRTEDVDRGGTTPTTSPTTRICPAGDCGAPVPDEADTCPYCRTPLDTIATSDEPNRPPAPQVGEDDPDADRRLPAALAERFRVVEELPATGAEADLFLVAARDGGPIEVLKLYRAGVEIDLDLLTEISRADIAHVVEVRDHGRAGARGFEVLEYIEAGDLRDFQERHGPALGPDLARTVLQELADALEHLHELRVQHGDVKPGNVLVRTEEPLDLVLADFGLAAVNDATLVFDAGARRSQYYAAPEQIGETTGRPADVWALGVVVMELLLGRHPFADIDAGTIAYNLMYQPWPVAPDLIDDDRWQQLFRGILHRDPLRRWSASEIQDWLAGLELPDIADPTGVGRASQPFEFEGRRYTSIPALAHALLQAWEPASRRVQHGAIRNWVRGQQLDADLEAWFDVLQDSPWDRHGRLVRAALRMNPELPPVFRGRSFGDDGIVALCSTALADPASEDATIIASALDQYVFHGIAGITGSPLHQHIADRLDESRDRIAQVLAEVAEDDLDADGIEGLVDIRLLHLLADPDEHRRVATAVRRRPPRDLPRWYRPLLREDADVVDTVLAEALRPIVRERADDLREQREGAELEARAIGGGFEGLLARWARVAVGLLAAGAAFIAPWVTLTLLLAYAAVSRYGTRLRQRLRAARDPDTGHRRVGATIDAALRWLVALVPRMALDAVGVLLIGALWVAAVLVIAWIGHGLAPDPQVPLEVLLRRLVLPAAAFQGAYWLVATRADEAPYRAAGRLERTLRLAPLTLLIAVWVAGGAAVWLGWTLGDDQPLAQVEPAALSALRDAQDWWDDRSDARNDDVQRTEPEPPPPEPVDASPPPTWVVSGAAALNVRTEPDLDARILMTANEGTELIGTGRTEQVDEIPWVEVELPDGGTGWASGRYLDRLD